MNDLQFIEMQLRQIGLAIQELRTLANASLYGIPRPEAMQTLADTQEHVQKAALALQQLNKAK